MVPSRQFKNRSILTCPSAADTAASNCVPKTATLVKAESKPLQKCKADEILPVCNTEHLVEELVGSKKARKHHAL